MRIRYRAVTSVVLLAGLSAAAAGCGGTGHTRARTTAALLPASDTNVVPYSRVRSGGTLRLQIENYPAQFNFNQVDGPLEATSEIMSALMPTPFLTNAHGVARADPAYVTSYTATPASAGRPQVIELHLNTRARWSDGTPITAADYIMQWKALNGSDPAFDPAGPTGFSDIRSVTRGASPDQVIYTFSHPFGEWQALFGIIFPAKYNATPRAFDDGYLNTIPVTGGPFELGRLDPAAETVTVVRNPRFWWRPAKLNSIVFETLSDEAAVQALANGELDNVEVHNLAEYDQVKNTPGIVARQAVSAAWPAIMFNAKNPILADVRVRLALQLAVDRPAIIASQLKGLPVPAIQPLGNHILLPSESGYASDTGSYGTYDPAAARALLTRAGWTPGVGGVRYRAGRPLQLTMLLQQGDSVGQSIAELVQAMYQQVGVRLTVATINASDYFQDYVDEGNFQLGLWEWVDSPYPISNSEDVFQRPRGRNLFQNFGSVGSAAIDALLSQALGDTDMRRARRIADRADVLIWAEGHDLPIFTEPDIEMQQAGLANYGAFGLLLPDYTAMGYTSSSHD